MIVCKMATNKSRKANWSEKEVQCLVSECTDNIRLITAKHGDGYSEGMKSQFWKELCERINSQGGSGRSVEEIMKKWKYLKIITVIPNSVLEGIEGGLDLFQKNKVTTEAVLESAETVIQVGGEETVVFHPAVYMFREKSCREVKKKTWSQKKEG